jgi:sulfopyruvate decarboxylase subunit beta
MLMNLGTLVTMGSNPANLFVVLLDNGIYEVTGGQLTAGSGRVDYARLARAAGIQRVYAFDDYAVWRNGAAQALTGSGPAFVWLKVEARFGQKTPKAPRPMAEQIRRLHQVLQVNS